MTAIQTLDAFWSSFGIPAYDENTVPDSAPLPRLTYNVVYSNFDEPVAANASIWYYSYSWKEITEKADEINTAIGLGGRIINCDGGKIWIKRGIPFAQRMSDENDAIRRIYINIELEYFTTA